MKVKNAQCSKCGAIGEAYSYVVKAAGRSKKSVEASGEVYDHFKEQSLHAYLCPECEEENQQRLEKISGYQRGTKVKVNRGCNHIEWEIIDYYFDEESFVNDKGYVHQNSWIVSSQASLF